MTADDEIRNIRWTLEKIHQALYRIDKEFEEAIPEIDHISAKLEQILIDVASQANAIRNTTIRIASNFPSHSVYLIVLFILEIAACIITIALVYSLIISLNQLYHKQFPQSDKTRNRKLFRKNDKKDMKKHDSKAFICYSPQLSVTSSNSSYEKISKEFWIEMRDLDNQQLLHQEKV
uniref:Uncharacterized protein n=1 Tax=Setaria digitata TaxID=48799 RepID=A0A915Q625_9BILA